MQCGGGLRASSFWSLLATGPSRPPSCPELGVETPPLGHQAVPGEEVIAVDPLPAGLRAAFVDQPGWGCKVPPPTCASLC